MATLADMKASIASEIMRDDLTDAIAKEIMKAINFYKPKRFWFTERLETVTFSTVQGQTRYTASASPYIPNLIRIDSMTMNRTGGVWSLDPIGELDMKKLLGGTAPMSSISQYYSYYGQLLDIYPIPDGVYPVIIAGLIRIAAPATDDEENNPWMNDAEELIRSRAKRNLFLHWMEDRESASSMKDAEDEALLSLQQETSSRTQVDRLIPSDC